MKNQTLYKGKKEPKGKKCGCCAAIFGLLLTLGTLALVIVYGTVWVPNGIKAQLIKNQLTAFLSGLGSNATTTVNSTILTNTKENPDDFDLFTTNADGLYDGLTDENPISNGENGDKSDSVTEEQTLNQVTETPKVEEKSTNNDENERYLKR